jgi:hypothetical protein
MNRLDWRHSWRLWRVIIPRRAITISLVWGQVWRRHDWDHWLCKRVAECADGELVNAQA